MEPCTNLSLVDTRHDVKALGLYTNQQCHTTIMNHYHEPV